MDSRLLEKRHLFSDVIVDGEALFEIASRPNRSLDRRQTTYFAECRVLQACRAQLRLENVTAPISGVW